MQYIALIHASEEGRDERREQTWKDYGAFFADERVERAYRGGDALGPSTLATRVRVRGGRRSVLDGPFIESKEQLAGFMIFECEDLDEALELAARIPDARRGVVEVRPLAQPPDCHEENASWRR